MSRLGFCALTVGLALCGPLSGWCADSEVPDGFESLFNGKDLTGWTVHGPSGGWSVQDGVLVASGESPSWLMTEREYGDFEVRLEYRATRGANSGVALRSPLRGNPALTGMEIQILDDANYSGLRPTQYTGALYNVAAPQKGVARPAGEWNALRITARGRRLAVVLNDTTVLDADLDTYADHAVAIPGLLRTEGHIGLQNHTGQVEFRRLFVRPLARRPAAPEENVSARPHLVLDAGGHTDGVTGVLFTPDGKQLISSSKDRTARLWDVASGEMVRTFRPPIGAGRAGILYGLALSPDGRTLALGGTGLREGDNPIYLVSPESGHIERVLRGHTNTIVRLAFSPDGELLASAGEDATARIWNARTGVCEQVLRGHSRPIYDLAFSPKGDRLITGAFDATARLWDVSTGRATAVLKDAYKERFYWIRSVAWSPDGNTVATGGADWCVRLWSSEGKLLKRYGPFGDWVRSLTFTADSRRLLFNSSLLELESGEVQAQLRRGTGKLFQSRLSPDGTLAASGGFQGEEFFLWKASDGSLVRQLAGRGRTVWSTGWSADGKTIAWGNSGEISYENILHPLERSFRLEDLELGKAPDQDFERARTAGKAIVLEHPRGQESVTVKEDAEVLSVLGMDKDNPCICWALLPDAEQAVVGGVKGLYLFDIRTGKRLRSFVGHTGDLCAVTPSPDGRYVLSGSSDQTLRIWKLDQGAPLLSLFFAGDEWIAWTPEGYYACSPGGEKLMGWQLNNGPDKMATFYPADKFHKSLYRPDVIKRLLAAGSTDKALAVADRARGKRAEHIDVSRVLPPRVAITSPKPGTSLDSTEVRVEASATSVGGHPVTALRLLLDGRPYGGQASLKKVARPQPGEVKQSWTVTLAPGKHRLAVQADSAVSEGTSEEVEVVSTDKAAADSERPAVKLYVLAVGINDYPDKLKLRCAANDARAVADAFQEHSGALYQQVECKVLTDDKASRKGILDGLTWLRKEMTQRDVAVVFFAGHGAKDSEGSLYLLPADVDPENLLSSAVAGEQVKKALAALPGRVLFLLDACHAGAAGGDRRRASEALTDELVQDLATDDYGVVVMCAAMSREYSLESKKLGHGYFTQALVEGLQGKAAKGSGAVYLHHLDGYVTDRVKELTGGLQHPVTAKPTSIRSFPLSRP